MTTAWYLCDCLRVIINHLVELSDHFHLCLYLPFELVQLLQDLLHVDVHIVDVFAMTIAAHPDPVDLIILGFEYSTDFLGNQSQVALQFVPLQRQSACLHNKRDKMINEPCPQAASVLPTYTWG